ncbi:HAMP domain-containing histidine kinase [Piscinibacter aquaticus]|uniref:histidine kinase n=1 Tax=Piscinibacter aquaticus TaxID=392597 RepID=A0A5C6U0N6_9BURK|nr:HAMP domain-containing histidine kinase [Piscinibacter aquaticus]
MIAALLALTMLAISIVFLRAGRELSQRLAQIEATMGAARAGDRPRASASRFATTSSAACRGTSTSCWPPWPHRSATSRRRYCSEPERCTTAPSSSTRSSRSAPMAGVLRRAPPRAFRQPGLRGHDRLRGRAAGRHGRGRAVRPDGAPVAAAAAFPGLAALRDSGQGATFELQQPVRRVLSARMQLASAAHVSQVLYVRDVTHETEVDRMKSEFLTTAAHELRTPMTSIYGYVELLLAREMPAPRQRAVLDTVSRQSTLMMAIINQLLDLARIEARRGSDFELERLDLAAAAAATAADYRPPEGREAPRFAAAAQPMPVQADARKLQQALLNILSNAYKYSPAGGAVEISFRRDEHGGRVRHGVAMRDHGIGMNETQRSRIFERFYRADASGNIPGTGLGMSIVKEIVELHGGSVDIDSAPGAGTCMTVWLPAPEPRVQPGARASARSRSNIVCCSPQCSITASRAPPIRRRRRARRPGRSPGTAAARSGAAADRRCRRAAAPACEGRRGRSRPTSGARCSAGLRSSRAARHASRHG